MNRSWMGAVAWTAGAAALLAATDAQSAQRRRISRADLVAPVGASMERARGEITTRLARRGRQVMVVVARGLAPNRDYALCVDDPSTPEREAIAFATVRSDAFGRVHARFDTAGRGMPFSATLTELAEKRFEVRDGADHLVLSGEVPNAEPRATPAPGCQFVEEEVFADTFDADAVGAAPTGWDVAGTDVAGITVLVDSLVADGGVGASVQLVDTVALDPGSPSLSHAFTAQDHTFAVEFALTSSAVNGQVTANVGDDTDTGTVFPAGLGTGLGFYEDGTIGFAVGDAIQTYAPSTTYHFRVEFDLDADTFDVAIDGTTVVTGRALGADFTQLERLTFSGSATTVGTANVDTVRVIRLVQDCPPVANAGLDQVVECGGDTTAVTLDGSGSSDPEGATLTYAWTGPFVEGTAEGVNPTVHFAGTGSFTVSLTVSDGTTTSAADEVAIEVNDTLPPVIEVTGLVSQIWPPNHKLVALTPTVTVTDACDTAGTGITTTLAITSNEDDNALGDGNTTDDIVIRSFSDFDLRAERSGPGSGRVYTLVWTATDAAGNTATFETTVTVPHDMGHGDGSVGAGDDEGDDDDADDDTDEDGDDETPPATPPGLVDNDHANGNAYGHTKQRGGRHRHRHRR